VFHLCRYFFVPRAASEWPPAVAVFDNMVSTTLDVYFNCRDVVGDIPAVQRSKPFEQVKYRSPIYYIVGFRMGVWISFWGLCCRPGRGSPSFFLIGNDLLLQSA
jgi:hypothetical protein